MYVRTYLYEKENDKHKPAIRERLFTFFDKWNENISCLNLKLSATWIEPKLEINSKLYS